MFLQKEITALKELCISKGANDEDVKGCKPRRRSEYSNEQKKAASVDDDRRVTKPVVGDRISPSEESWEKVIVILQRNRPLSQVYFKS